MSLLLALAPAGYTAAIYTSRARLETQVIAGVQGWRPIDVDDRG
jgi:thioredoxin reductase